MIAPGCLCRSYAPTAAESCRPPELNLWPDFSPFDSELARRLALGLPPPGHVPPPPGQADDRNQGSIRQDPGRHSEHGDAGLAPDLPMVASEAGNLLLVVSLDPSSVGGPSEPHTPGPPAGETCAQAVPWPGPDMQVASERTGVQAPRVGGNCGSMAGESVPVAPDSLPGQDKAGALAPGISRPVPFLPKAEPSVPTVRSGTPQSGAETTSGGRAHPAAGSSPEAVCPETAGGSSAIQALDLKLGLSGLRVDRTRATPAAGAPASDDAGCPGTAQGAPSRSAVLQALHEPGGDPATVDHVPPDGPDGLGLVRTGWGERAEPAEAHMEPTNRHGTSRAPWEIAMNNTAHEPKDAGLSQQNLPGHGENVISPAPAAATETGASGRAPSAPLQLLFHALERTFDIVHLHAARVRESHHDPMHVVIKPGAGVQLSMTLRQEGDQVHAEVWMHRGDFDFFQRHWKELQERCQARGIQLGDLQRHPDYQSDQHRSGYRPPDGDWADPLSAGAYAEFALAGSLTEPPGRRAFRLARHRGWETWA